MRWFAFSALMPLVVAPVFAQPIWHVNSAGAEPRVGAIKVLGPKFALSLIEPTAEIAVGELISFRQASVARPGKPFRPLLILSNGDCWPGVPAGGRGLALDWSLRIAENVTAKVIVPLPSVRAIWFVPPSDPETDPTTYDWIEAKKKQDTVQLRNGDVLRGAVESFAEEGGELRFRGSGELAAKTLAFDTIAAVVFDPALARARVLKGPYAKIVLRSGTRLTAASATSDGKTLAVTAATGGTVSIPLSEIVSLDVLQGRAAYLADLTSKATVEPFGAVRWEWKANGNVKGDPLRLAGPHGEDTFDRGLGTHSKTDLRYDLAGKYRTFEATVGLDARTGKKGHGAVSVFVDGSPQPLPALADLKPGSAVPLRIDVAKAKELRLLIDFGPGGDVQDDVNWGDARLIE